MICPCGGIANGTDYFPVGKNTKQTTYTCNACGRRKLELRGRDFSWIASALRKAYEFGLADRAPE